MDIKGKDIPEEIWNAADRYAVDFDARYYGDSPPPREQWVQFEAWLKADPRHAFAYECSKDVKDWVYERLSRRRGRREPQQS
jgi:hypothetical protein